jgi:hypothetical protein
LDATGAVKTMTKRVWGILFKGPAFSLPQGARRFSLTISEAVRQSTPAAGTKLATFVLAPTLLPGEMQTLFITYVPFGGFNTADNQSLSAGSSILFQMSGNTFFVLNNELQQRLRINNQVSPRGELISGMGTYSKVEGGPYQYVQAHSDGFSFDQIAFTRITSVGIQYTGSAAGLFPSIVVFAATGMNHDTDDFVAPTL